MPYGDQENIDSPTMVYYRGDSLDMVRRDSAWKSQIDIAHAAGFRVFLKPHVWISAPTAGKWRSDVFPSNDKNWKLWQASYRDFILAYAKIAAENKVELFCVGTEFSRLAIEKPLFWRQLIRDVRRVYTGKITYAANWYEEFEKITFWDDLDYIGIQAYFPLVKNEYPTVPQLAKAWDKHIPSIEVIHQQYQRKILFTEMGYKSTADSAISPWEWIDYTGKPDKAVSDETQANCYAAFFDVIWNKDWLAGVHLWQWRSDFEKGRGKSHLDFTPQGKPAERLISTRFGEK